jgi:hypothetical protein
MPPSFNAPLFQGPPHPWSQQQRQQLPPSCPPPQPFQSVRQQQELWHHQQQQISTPFGVATHLPATPRLTEIFTYTPFGIYCCVCQVSVGPAFDTIDRHLETKHHGVYSKDAVRTFKTIADKEVQRLSRLPNLKSYLVGCGSTGFACGCGAHFKERKFLNRHCKTGKSCQFKPEDSKKELIYDTTCGRTVSETKLQEFVLSSPLTTGRFNFKDTEGNMRKYVRKDERIDSILALLHSFVHSFGPDFDLELSKRVDDRSKPAAEDEQGLKLVLEAGEKWIATIARHLVDLVPGNLRALLQVFEGQLVGDVTQNVVFTYRTNDAPLRYELKLLLSFVWRHSGNLLHFFKQNVNANTHDYDMLVPDILRALLLEKVDDGFDTLPLVAHYCLARCFRRRSGQIEMAQAGDNASAVAAVMSVLRAGACSYMVISEMGDTAAKEFVNKVRSGLDTGRFVELNLVSNPAIPALYEGWKNWL